ncbi:hypothetical protein HDZ31DRAFT_50274, partial [Schizophyllum fasciatum]
RESACAAHPSQLRRTCSVLSGPPCSFQSRLDPPPSHLQSERDAGGPRRTSPESPAPPLHGQPLYDYVPLPSQVDGVTRAVLHPLLAGSYSFDLCRPPPLAPLGNRAHETATWPPAPSLAIVMAALPSPIVVHAASYGGQVTREDRTFVTVADVLEALYLDLQQPAVGYERRGGRVARHIPRGTLISGDGQYRADVRLVQRGELLRGHRLFVALSPSELGGEVFTLHVA